MENETIKKRSKKTTILIIAAAAVIVAVVTIVVLLSGSAGRKLREQLALGDRYLSEMDYEKAVAAYRAAIEIDPDAKDAYEGFTLAYLGWADAEAEGVGTPQAIVRLEQGQTELEAFRSEENAEFIKVLLSRILERMDRLKAAEEKKEPEAEPEEEPAEEEKKELLHFVFQKKTDQVLGAAYGGVVPVQKDGLYGAENYAGETVVPYEYDSYRSANEAGYIVMIKTVDYENEYFLYDKNGTLIYNGPDCVVAASDMYIIYRGVEDEYSIQELVYDFYDYSGNKLFTLESGLYPHQAVIRNSECGVINGKALVIRATEQESYLPIEDKGHPYIPFEIGVVSADGSVEWINGDGLDENDPSETISESENERRIREMYPDVHANAGGASSVPAFPLSPLNEGYFVTWEPFEPIVMMDAGGNVVSALYLDGLSFDDPGSINYTVRDDCLGAHKYKVYRADGGDVYSGASVEAFFQDGGFVYNWGTKVLLSSGDVYGLVDMNITGDRPVIKTYDYISMSNEKYWLAQIDGKWGYTDHEGEAVKMYDDAAKFYKGYALVLENGEACLIDDELNIVEELGTADSVSQYGELFVLIKGDTKEFYSLEAQ